MILITSFVMQLCPGGTIPNTTTHTCTECAAGTYSINGTTVCSSCPNGTYSSAGSSSCTNCPAGHRYVYIKWFGLKKTEGGGNLVFTF